MASAERTIWLITLAFLALAGTWSALIPLGEGPDEAGHAAYVFFLAREQRLPVQSQATGGEVPGEGHQPPLAYLLMTPLVSWLPAAERTFDLPGNARFTWSGGSELNAVAHGSREYLPWRGAVLAWHLARLVGAALGALTVFCTYRAARAFGSRPAVALLAALLVAGNPQFLFSAALITNDTLLVALCAVLLWLVAGPASQPTTMPVRGSVGRAALVGLVLGLALLTKQSALLLVPVALLWCLPGAPTMPLGRRGWTALLRGAVLAGTTLLVAGWWYLRNWRLYGDPLGLAVFKAEFTTQPFEANRLAAWLGALSQLHDSFWARFGWMNVVPPAWVLWVFVAIELLALEGLLRWLVAARAAGTRSLGVWRYAWPLVVLPVLALAWLVSFAYTAGLVAWQGRLAFPALPALAIGLAQGLGRAWPTRWGALAGRAAGGLLALGLAGLALWLPFGVIRPAYPFHTLPEQAALERLGTPAYGRFGKAGDPGAELRGWQLSGPARPGTTLELALLWHALGRQNRDWTVFIHLVDASETIVAQNNRQPQDGAFPMTQWVQGDWVADQHPLELPATLAPGSYTLRVGLFDPRTGRRAGQYNKRGKLRGDALVLGQIVVQ